MKYFVLDSFALIALYRKERGHEYLVKLLKQAITDAVEWHMSSINVGELFYILCRKANVGFATEALEETLKLPIQIHEPSLNETLLAARLKAGCKLSFTDAHAAALAIRVKATLTTGDREFENLRSEPGFMVEYL